MTQFREVFAAFWAIVSAVENILQSQTQGGAPDSESSTAHCTSSVIMKQMQKFGPFMLQDCSWELKVPHPTASPPPPTARPASS